MRYMLLIYTRETDWTSLPKDEQRKIAAEYGAYTESIKASGHYRSGDGLEPTARARTVRARNGRPVSTDGPFAETREQLGGYYVIEAKDLDEACALAARVPGASHGAVEVRPVMEM
jgi:hypothetical protein